MMSMTRVVGHTTKRPMSELHFPELPTYIRAEVRFGEPITQRFISGNTYVVEEEGRDVSVYVTSTMHVGGEAKLPGSWTEGYVNKYTNRFLTEERERERQ